MKVKVSTATVYSHTKRCLIDFFGIDQASRRSPRAMPTIGEHGLESPKTKNLTAGQGRALATTPSADAAALPGNSSALRSASE